MVIDLPCSVWFWTTGTGRVERLGAPGRVELVALLQQLLGATFGGVAGFSRFQPRELSELGREAVNL